MKVLDRLARKLGYIRKRNGGWYGAQHSRLTSDWLTMASGPNAELYSAMRTLRDRARDLEKNNALVRRYLSLVAENVIGDRGVKLQCRNVMPDGRQNEKANAAIEGAWAEWSRPENLSVDGRMGLAAFEQAVMRGVARDGEAFVRIVRSTPYGIGLQLIDPALVDETLNREAGQGRGKIVLGVEMNDWGRPVAYHVCKGHPNDFTDRGGRETERIPADQMLHLFVPRRPGQVRGESWLAPVMFLLKMRDGYVEAETIAARTGSMKMGFIINDPEGPTAAAPEDGGSREMEAAPGIIEELDAGQTFQSWDPSHPSQNFALFVTQVDKSIAAGLNVSFASLTSDLREVNYSSARIGLIQEREAWRVHQRWFAEQFCEPVFRAWQPVAWAKGHVSLRMVPEAYRDHQWQPRGWEYTNPREEQMADLLAIAGGFTSPQRVLAKRGEDLEEVYAELEAARLLAERYGVERYVPNSVVSADDGEDDGTDDGEDDGTGNAAADAGDRPGRDGAAGGRGRSDSRLAVVRAAG